MGQTADELRSELDRKRVELTRDVDRIEDKVRSTFDLRQQVEQNPLQMTGLAIAAGFVLGNLVGGHHSEESGQAFRSNQHRTAGMGMSGLAPSSAGLAGGIYSREATPQSMPEPHDGPSFFATMGESVKQGFQRSTGGNSFEATLSSVSATMLAMLLDKAKEALDSNLPGFAEKFEQMSEPPQASSPRSAADAGQGGRRPAMAGSPAVTPTTHHSTATNDRPSVS